jgi:hypothetical protein
VNLEQVKWCARHEVALYFAPATGALKGIRRAFMARGRQSTCTTLLSFAPLLSGLSGIGREYRALERLAERRRLTKVRGN